eukprot:scaffold813_cov148-Amphora_coffeaeformis.AAC.5
MFEKEVLSSQVSVAFCAAMGRRCIPYSSAVAQNCGGALPKIQSCEIFPICFAFEYYSQAEHPSY